MGVLKRSSKVPRCVSCKDLYYFLYSGIKMVQIMQGFIGCRKVPPHFVQGFILFFAFGRLRKSSKSAKPRKTYVNCSFLRSRGGKFNYYIRKMYIFSILVAKMLFLHKENVYFQYWRTQNLIITYGKCIFPAFDIAKSDYYIRKMYIFSISNDEIFILHKENMYSSKSLIPMIAS